jgi:hypothetical protein
MSGSIDETGSAAREAAADAVWRQWSLLGAPVAGASPAPRSVIDPEALLLLSASIRSSERRLDDVLGWWAAAGSPLLSVQRTTTMLRHFPPSTRAGVASFAAAAVEAGDGRWNTLARAAGAETLASRGKRGGEPRLTSCPALMLRLRAGFGVGVKADLLAILLSMGGTDATVRSLSTASGYTPASVRRAAQEMEAAGFVRRVKGRPAGYFVEPRRWSDLLAAPERKGSEWRWLAQVFAFLAWTSEWSVQQRESSAYIAGTTARDLTEEHRAAFDQNRIILTGFFRYAGESYVDAFRDDVKAIADWLRISL